MSSRDLLMAATVVVVWGVNFVVIKVGLRDLPPLLLGALRFLFSAFPAVLLVPRPRLSVKWILAYGLTIGFGQFAFLFTAMHLGMPAGLASVVLQAQVLLTVALAALLLGERWQAQSAAGMLVAGCGLALIGRAAGPGGGSLAGFLLTLCAALCWAAGNIVTRRLGRVDLLSLVVWSALVPPLPFLALSLLVEGRARVGAALAGLRGPDIAAVAYLAFGATLLGYTLWGKLLSRHPAQRVAPLAMLVPVVGLVSASAALGERLSAGQSLGAVLVMAGLLVNQFGGHVGSALGRARFGLGSKRRASSPPPARPAPGRKAC